jgi:hypothetical protein
MTRVLIVANQTAGGRHLHDEVRRRRDQGQRNFTLLVPSSRPHGTFTWTDGQARALAQRRMETAIRMLSDLDIEIDGVVGVAPTALDAVRDLMRERPFDEVIVSTYPHPVSHWMRMDLPSRIEYHSGKPVTHIVASVKERIGAA